jgi:hypothetical protein
VVSVTPLQHFGPGERTPGTHCTRGWVGLRACLFTEVRGKNPLPLPGIEPQSPGRPVHRQILYWLSYPGSPYVTQSSKICIINRMKAKTMWKILTGVSLLRLVVITIVTTYQKGLDTDQSRLDSRRIHIKFSSLPIYPEQLCGFEFIKREPRHHFPWNKAGQCQHHNLPS